MSLSSIIQYATLFSLLIGLLGLGTAMLIHRQQVTTQIFLAVSSRDREPVIGTVFGERPAILVRRTLSRSSCHRDKSNPFRHVPKRPSFRECRCPNQAGISSILSADRRSSSIVGRPKYQ